MNSNHLFSTLILLVLFTASCAPEYYAPNNHSVPILKKKGDVQANAHIGAYSKEGHAAYAVNNHLGVVANFSHFNRKPTENRTDGFGNGRMFEAGAGYFNHFHPFFQFEAYTYYGFGRVSNTFLEPGEFDDTKGVINANFTKLNFQPSIAFTSRYVDLAFSTRLAQVSYRNISGDLVHAGELQTDYLMANSRQWMIEPALTLRFGYDPIKAHLQVGFTQNLTNPSFHQNNALIGLGLSTSFSTLFND